MSHLLKKRYLLQIVAIFLALLSGCAQAPKVTVPSVQEESIAAAEPSQQPKESIQTILMIYLDQFDVPQDSGAYRNGNKADLLMLMIMNEERGKLTALQLNPDTIVSFSAQGMSETIDIPLGMVYSYGSGGSDSCLNERKAVSNLLGGISIDHYMTFTVDSIPIVNDMVGGVTVTVTEDFSDEYPELVKGESLKLLGENAAAFFRFRNDEDITNEGHMERQRQYITGLYTPFMENAKQEDFLTRLTVRLGDAFATDLTLSQMMQMFQSLGMYELDETFVTIQGKADKVNGEIQFYVDEDSLNKTVKELFLNKLTAFIQERIDSKGKGTSIV